MAMVYLVIRFVVAFFVYKHAKKRGHGDVAAVLWATGSAVMPIVLVPLYLLLGGYGKRRNTDYDDGIIDIEATVIEEEMINCSKCGNRIKDDFMVCPYCQTPVDQSERYHKN